MNITNRKLIATLAIAAVVAACNPTDTGISNKVKANLSADATLNTAQIVVGVEKQVVTLSGSVDTSGSKEQAVAIARRSDGVADVVDQLSIRGNESGPGHGHEMMEKGMTEGRERADQEKRQ